MSPDRGFARFSPGAGLRWALLATVCVAGAQGATAEITPTLCGPDSVLTPFGFDSRAAIAWFALTHSASSGDAERRLLVEWHPGSSRATLREEHNPDGRFAPSSGPGGLMALRRCGDGCLQPVTFDGSEWRPLGGTLPRPEGGNAHTTYDRSGTPWVVFHTPAQTAGTVVAHGYRLESEQWIAKGRLAVLAAGHPGAGPAPWQDDAVVSGTGLFSAATAPRAWLAGLPATEGRGQVVPLTRGSAAYVTADSQIFRTVDGGKSWSRSPWTPWRRGTAEPWQRGLDFDVDLPSGFDSGALQIAWFDRRRQGETKVILTEMTPAGRWRVVATFPDAVKTEDGEALPLSHVLGPATGPWSLIYGCVQSGGKPGLVLRSPTTDEGRARVVPIELP